MSSDPRGIRISYSDALGLLDMLDAGDLDAARTAFNLLIDRRKAEVQAELVCETEGGLIRFDGRTVEDDGYITIASSGAAHAS